MSEIFRSTAPHKRRLTPPSPARPGPGSWTEQDERKRRGITSGMSASGANTGETSWCYRGSTECDTMALGTQLQQVTENCNVMDVQAASSRVTAMLQGNNACANDTIPKPEQ